MLERERFVEFVMPPQKHIALIAHDNKKKDIIEWVKEHERILRKHFLYGTGTTARLISDETNLPITAYNSGPLGGDQQIGSRIVEGKIDFVIFFWDPLESQPHDPDIKALLRIATVYDVPLATNRATSDFLIKSIYMNENYTRHVLNYNNIIKNRVDNFSKSGESDLIPK